MKIVVFSDIHGNYKALEALLKETSDLNIDKYIHCGDIFGYLYDQSMIIDKFTSMTNLISILGNHDLIFLKLSQQKEILESLVEKYGISYKINFKKITESQLNYIKYLPTLYSLQYNNLKIGFFHGSPFDLLEGRIYPDSEIDARIGCLDYDIIFLGHTHYRMHRKIGEIDIYNPGSLGFPRDGLGFGYILADLDTGKIEFKDINLQTLEVVNMINNNDEKKDVFVNVLSRKVDTQ